MGGAERVLSSKRVGLYLRVSTDGQTVENQRLALQAEAARRGWRVIEIYEDAGISGAKGRDKRPGLDRLLKDATRGKLDVVACWALDRLGRSLADLIAMLQEMETARVDLFIMQQAIDTTAPAGRLFFHMLGAFGEFERSMIRQRVKAGLERAREAGTVFGRPRVSGAVEAEIRERLGAGTGIVKVAKQLGIGVSTVQRVKRDMAAPAAQ